MRLHAWLSFINVTWFFFFYFSSISRETKWSSCGTLSLGRGTQLFIPKFWAFFRSTQQPVFSLMGITHLTISRYTFHIPIADCTILGCKNNKMNALSAFYCHFFNLSVAMNKHKKENHKITPFHISEKPKCPNICFRHPLLDSIKFISQPMN